MWARASGVAFTKKPRIVRNHHLPIAGWTKAPHSDATSECHVDRKKMPMAHNARREQAADNGISG
jgi:hypothetical protein